MEKQRLYQSSNTAILKTKLFIIVDKLTLDKITKDCRIGEDCSKMVEKVGANKI